jgi:hypothetical protein
VVSTGSNRLGRAWTRIGARMPKRIGDIGFSRAVEHARVKGRHGR